MVCLSYFPFLFYAHFAEKNASILRIGAEGGTRTHKKLVLNQLCLPIAITSASIGASGESRTPKHFVLSEVGLPIALTLASMEPRIGRAPISAVYETAESLSILTGHSPNFLANRASRGNLFCTLQLLATYLAALILIISPIITGSPIIVKCKSVPAPFTLRGPPQQDWGSGSLPHRNLINWSGWQDLNLRFLASEARGVAGLSYTQNHGAGYGSCTRDDGLEDHHVAATPNPHILLTWSGGRESNSRGLPWQGSTWPLCHPRIFLLLWCSHEESNLDVPLFRRPHCHCAIGA